MEIVFDGRAAGVTFNPAKKNIKKLYRGGIKEPKLRLVPMPENKYDKNAIRVVTDFLGRVIELGWVPKTDNSRMLEYGLSNIHCMFGGYNMYEDEVVGISIVLIHAPEG